MNFYRRRPLTLSISICLAVSAAVSNLSGVIKLVFAFMLPLACVAVIMLLCHHGITEICGLKSTPFAIITVALCMCFTLTSYAYHDVYAAGYGKLDDGRLTVVVTDIKSQLSYGSVYVVRMKELNGEKIGGKGLLGSSGANSLSVGDVVEADAVFVSTEEFYGVIDTSRSLLADGYLFTCRADGEVKITGRTLTPEVFLARLRHSFAAKMSKYMDDDSSALANALFLGDRSGLEKIYRDFVVSGVVHVLALSGMHLSILAGGLERFLRVFGIRGKLRVVPIILFVLFYTALTGFLMPVVRAAIMLVLVYVAELIDSRSDAVTSLFVSVGLIVLAAPAALFDISLQMSFFATLGVILFAEELSCYEQNVGTVTKYGIWRKPLFRILGSAVSSIGASLFVLPLQWLYFGKFSLLGIPATIIMSTLCEGLLIVYPFLLICGMAGLDLAAYVFGAVADFITKIVSRAADFTAGILPLVSFEYPFSLPLLICLISAIVFMVIKNYKSWIMALVPISLFFTLYLGSVAIYDYINYHDMELDFVNYKSHDSIVLVSERQAMVVDISNGSGTVLSLAGDCVCDRYITEIDTLLLTDASSKHINAVRSFLKYNVTRRVLIPVPADDTKYSSAEAIAKIAVGYGADAIFYSFEDGGELRFGELTLTFSGRDYLSRSVQPMEVIRISGGGKSAAYLSRSSWESDRLWNFAVESEYLIFGNNGPNYKAPPRLPFSQRTENIFVVSDEYLSDLGGICLEFDRGITVGNYYSVDLAV